MADKETLLITGSSGLLGSALMQRFAGKYRVFGFDIEKSDDMPADSTFVEVDLCSDDSVDDGLRRIRQQAGDNIRSVIHLAAYYDFSGEPSPLYNELTVGGTRRLIRALQKFDVGQFVFSSTMLVHAPTKIGQPINEDDLLEPKWDYPESKVQTEQLLREQHGGIPLVILRIAGVYDDFGHSVPICHQIQRISERRMTSKVYPGDTNCGQAFLHMDDLVDAVARVVERHGRLPEESTLLLGEPSTMSYDNIQKQLGRLIHDEEWETTQIPKIVAKTGAWVQDNVPIGEDPFIKPWMIDMADDHYELDISRAKEKLDWQPGHSLRETLPKMVHALRANPTRWYQEHNLELPADWKELAVSR